MLSGGQIILKYTDTEELLSYLRTFASEWGHSTYEELQLFVGFEKKTEGGNGGSGKKSRRRSVGLF